MPEHLTIRAVADDEWRTVGNVVRAALLNQPMSDEALERARPSVRASDALAAWEGDRCVGHVAAFRLEMVVPGGRRLRTAGVTRVGVLPTHTRRGLLRTMMERLLREARGRGQPIAALLSSEAPIYGRFGFGHATDHVSARITAAEARPLSGPALAGSMRIVDHDEATTVVPEVYERCLGNRPGQVARDAWMWRWNLSDVAVPTSDRESRGHYVAVHTGADGTDDGYVRYQAGWEDDQSGNPSAVGEVHELVGADADVELALWRYVLDVDLVRHWTAELRPVDDPARRACRDLRAYRTLRRLDELWVRLLDVDAALRARRFGPARDAVHLEVRDPLFDENTGTWSLSADGAHRSDDEPDAVVDVASLSAAYLGGVSWRELRDAGRVDGQVDAAVIERLDALFAVRPGPFCGTHF